MLFKGTLIFTMLFFVLNLNAQSKFGLDIPLHLSKSFVVIPDAFSPAEGDGGNGMDIGLGMFYQVNENFKLKAGFHFWNISFNPTYEGTLKIDGRNVDGKITEKGNIKYTGIYISALYENKFAYLGGGFDISFSNSYISDISVYNSNNQLVAKEEDSDESFLTDQFNNQIDFVLLLGFKIKLNNRISLIPTAQFSLPFSELFDTNVTVYDPITDSTGDARIDAFLFKYGIDIEFSL